MATARRMLRKCSVQEEAAGRGLPGPVNRKVRQVKKQSHTVTRGFRTLQSHVFFFWV